MSVLKDDGTKRLIDQILASLKIGKYAIMDKVLNINSKNPVENGVITTAINGINERINGINERIDNIGQFTLVTLSEDVTIPTHDSETVTFTYDLSEYSSYAIVETFAETTNRKRIGAYLSDENGYGSSTDYLYPLTADNSSTNLQVDVTMINKALDTRTYTLGIKVLLMK